MSAPVNPDRRRVLAGLASGIGAATLAACSSSNDSNSALLSPSGSASNGASPAPLAPAGKSLPKPEDSGVDHIVVVMMENRSFDHMLGWVPGADGIQAGLSFKNIEGKSVSTFPLATETGYGYGGCGFADPNHSYAGGRIHLNKGAMDGWLLSDDTKLVPTDKFPVGYFTGADLPFYKGCVAEWTICDKYFSGILSATYPNRVYMHSGQTDRLSNTSATSTLPTIWDRMMAKGLSATYYSSDIPFLAIWGQKYVGSGTSSNLNGFLAQAAAGQLPSLSYIDPRFVGEGNQVSNDDHPSADVRDGQAFLNQVYSALTASPQWGKTLLIVTYDEWGGFYDHVVPPVGPISDAEKALGNDGRLGFRVPMILAGPRVAKNKVCKLQFDPQSTLDLITWRFGLDPIGNRHGWSLNLAYALDFDSAPRTDKPAFTVDSAPHERLCTGNSTLDGVTRIASTAPFSIKTGYSPDYLVKVANSSNPSESHFAEWLTLKTKAKDHDYLV